MIKDLMEKAIALNDKTIDHIWKYRLLGNISRSCFCSLPFPFPSIHKIASSECFWKPAVILEETHVREISQAAFPSFVSFVVSQLARPQYPLNGRGSVMERSICGDLVRISRLPLVLCAFIKLAHFSRSFSLGGRGQDLTKRTTISTAAVAS